MTARQFRLQQEQGRQQRRRVRAGAEHLYVALFDPDIPDIKGQADRAQAQSPMVEPARRRSVRPDGLFQGKCKWQRQTAVARQNTATVAVGRGADPARQNRIARPGQRAQQGEPISGQMARLESGAPTRDDQRGTGKPEQRTEQSDRSAVARPATDRKTARSTGARDRRSDPPRPPAPNAMPRNRARDIRTDPVCRKHRSSTELAAGAADHLLQQSRSGQVRRLWQSRSCSTVVVVSVQKPTVRTARSDQSRTAMKPMPVALIRVISRPPLRPG